MRLGSLLLFVCCAIAWSATLVRVESKADGRSYVVDLDREAVRKALQRADGGTGGIPGWLAPYQGAIPEGGAPGKSGSGSSLQYSARYAVGGDPAQTVAYYAQLLRSRGFVVAGSRTGLKAESRDATVYISSFPGSPRFNRSAGVSVSYRPMASNGGRSQLQGAGYDDATGVLHVRNRVTGETYYLHKDSIAANDLLWNEQAQQSMKLPAWLQLPEEIWGAGPPAPPAKREYGDRPALEVKFSSGLTGDRVCALMGRSLVQAGLSLSRACGPLEAWTPDRRARITVGMSNWIEFGNKADTVKGGLRSHSQKFVKGTLRYELVPGQ